MSLSKSMAKDKAGAKSLVLRSVTLWPANETRAPIVADVGFNMGAGETLALVGESGAGKTSLALAIMGLWPGRATGSIAFGADELTVPGSSVWPRLRGRELVLMMQDPMVSLNPVLTIGSQLREVLRCRRGLSRRESGSEALLWLSRVGLEPPADISHMYVNQLSGGMAQRALMAIALACEPALLIADEPFSALDPITASEEIALLKEHKDRLGFSLLLITHDLGLARDLADQILVLKDGLSVEAGPAKAVFDGPQHEYTMELLEASGLVDGAGIRI